METRRLLWFMALAFSVALLVQYFELPYGYLLSSLLSFGKSQATSGDSSPTRGSSNGNSTNVIGSSVVNYTKTNATDEFLNRTKLSSGTNGDVKQDLHSETKKKLSNDSSSVGQSREDGYLSRDILGINHNLTDKRVVRNESSAPEKARENGNSANNSSLGNLQATSPVPASAQNDEKPGLTQRHIPIFISNTSISRTPANTKRFKGPPALVVPISAMNDMLHQSRVSYRSTKPKWPSQADKELLNAKALIEGAQIMEKNHHIDVNVYRNFSAFTRSYELMEKTLKIYIYREGERPVFHEPELSGIYASEGWFMKQLEENKHFVTKNPNKAHLFYLPFSSRKLEVALYVPNSHSRRNLVQYLSSYLQNITKAYRFWERTSGTDHFLVACHDWAPAETSRIMKNCIRSLCNADVKRGFLFGKDVSLPEIYIRDALNPLKGLGGKPPSQRHILAFFAGRMHGYLRPVLLNYWENKDPDMKIFGKLKDTKGKMGYSQYMKSSKYCISAKGYEAYTPRVVEAIFYECVPVIISDNYIPPFFETLNWESFAVFILEKDIPNLKNILVSIPGKRYREMQQRVRQVQKHFLWHNMPVKYDVFHMILHSMWYTRVFQM